MRMIVVMRTTCVVLVTVIMTVAHHLELNVNR